ncbi:HPr family phosphocarrier protein [Alicyclobacillaceae bacterium I2511]|nr:HPr family phosphocarrier protein [Alicyclobacillaceae bacterium I2511]
MIEKTIVIQLASGLHARPASDFVQLANKFKAEIYLQKGEKHVNAKSILSLLALAATKGSSVTLQCNGEDESLAVEMLSEFLNKQEDGERP